MKKLCIVIGVLFCVWLFVACAVSAVDIQNANLPSTKTATDYVNIFKDAGFPLINIIEYNEETDANNLLGRPRQYISKVNFGDNRAEQFDKEYPVGGTVEVFSNKEDLNSRKEYIEQLKSFTKQYIYVSKDGRALLRIDFDLTPSQAEEYRKVFCGELEKVNIEAINSEEIAATSSSSTQGAKEIVPPKTEKEALVFILENIAENNFYDAWYYTVDFESDEIKTLNNFAFVVLCDDKKDYFMRNFYIENCLSPEYNGVLKDEIKDYCLAYADVGENIFGNTAYVISEEKTAEEITAKHPPKIGMTREQVWNSTWGYPDDINKTTTAYGVSEQYVYKRPNYNHKYIYLDDGIVTGIQD